MDIRETGEAGWLPRAGVTKKSVAGSVLFEDVRLKGEYSAVVRTGGGDPWWVEAITVNEATTKRVIELGAFAVTGRVTLGGEPCSANLVFGGLHAAPSVSTSAGTDGEFSVHLPRWGSWRVAVQPDRPRISRVVSVDVPRLTDDQAARIEISLPASQLRVRVVNSRGEAWTGRCLVHLESLVTHETLATLVENGEHDVISLNTGDWIVYAESSDDMSERLTVHMTDEGLQHVTLTLEEKLRVKGVVVSTLGAPVPYAKVQPLRWDARANLFPVPVTTDALGRFAVDVPPSVARVGLVVFAPGLPVTTAVVSPSGSRDVTIQVAPEGGRITLSYSSTDFPYPRFPYVSDTNVTYDALLLMSSPEVRRSSSGGRTYLEIPSYSAGPFQVCQTAGLGASDLESVGMGCVAGNATAAHNLSLDLPKSSAGKETQGPSSR